MKEIPLKHIYRMIAVINAPVDRIIKFDVYTNRQQVQWDPCQLHPLFMSSHDQKVPLSGQGHGIWHDVLG